MANNALMTTPSARAVTAAEIVNALGYWFNAAGFTTPKMRREAGTRHVVPNAAVYAVIPEVDCGQAWSYRRALGREDGLTVEAIQQATGVLLDPYATEWRTRKQLTTSRSIDLYAMGLWAKTKSRRVAIEIKVERSDFRKELRCPAKRVPAMLASHQFYFACPTGLVLPSECPPLTGLLEVDSAGLVTVARRAKMRQILVEPHPISYYSLLDAACKAPPYFTTPKNKEHANG